MNIHSLGCIPDKRDDRDFLFATPSFLLKKGLPTKVDLRITPIPIRYQGRKGACTGFGISRIHHRAQILQNQAKAFAPSELFLYYNERVMIRTVNEDSGAMIRDGMKSLAAEGICPDKMWTYDDGPFKFKKRPPEKCYREALRHQSVEYFRIAQKLQELKGCLASGFPFVFGINVYESFDKVGKDGKVSIPRKGEDCMGGHCMAVEGYNDDDGAFIVANSWDVTWGDEGYCYIPYEMFLMNDLINPYRNLASDFWKITLVEIDDVATA